MRRFLLDKFFKWRRATRGAVRDLYSNHILAYAGALSYYFILSLFPLLILAATAIAFLPIPNLFDTLLDTMARVVPPEGMGVVTGIAKDVVKGRPELLTFSLLGTIWAASGGFTAMIEALNIAYDVPETRAFWRVRLVAFGLTFLIGGLIVLALTATILGPQFGDWATRRIGLSPVFAAVWPYLRWTVLLVSIVLAIELLYYWAPNVEQRFLATLPGAAFAVIVWIAASQLFSLYVANFGNYNATYGTLAGAVVLMLWLYVTSVALLFGAEYNSELIKAFGEKPLEIKEEPEHAAQDQPIAA